MRVKQSSTKISTLRGKQWANNADFPKQKQQDSSGDLCCFLFFVPRERLELSWVAPLAPKASASTNFAIAA